MKTSLILLRHGQPRLQGCLLGRTDSKLTELGWQQMETSCIAMPNIELVVTSPLLRCKQFASEYAVKNGIPLECDVNWQECDFGDWDGIHYEKLHQGNGDIFEKFLMNPEKYTAPSGENLKAFNERIDTALIHLFEHHIGKTILLVSHAGVIRNLVAWSLGIERLSNSPYQRYSVDYGSTSQIDVFHEGELFSQLKNMNCVAKVSSQ